MTTSIPSNYSSVLSDFVKDQNQQATLWSQFIATLGLPANYTQAQLTAALSGTTRLNSFVAYLQSMPSLIPTTYLNSMKSFVQDPVQQADLWDKFVQTVDVPAGMTLTQVLSQTDTSAQFIKFLGEQFVAQANQILYSLSPDAVVQRAVLFNTFNLVINMLQTLQNTVAGEAGALTFYGKWQQDYTNLIAKVPIYTAQTSAVAPGNAATTFNGKVDYGTSTGASSSTGVLYVPNSWSASDIASGDLSKLSLVYGGFDLSDVVNSLAAQAVQSVNSTTGTTPGIISISSSPFVFTFSSNGFYTSSGPDSSNTTNSLAISMTLNLITNADGSGSVALGFNVLNTGQDSVVNAQNSYIPFVALPITNNYTPQNGDWFQTSVGGSSGTPGAIRANWSAPSGTAGSDATTSLASSITAAVNNVFSQTTLGTTGAVQFEIAQAGYLGNAYNYVIRPVNGAPAVFNNFNVTLGQAPQIAWQTDTTSATDTAQTTYTAQKNAKLQQYIQTLQSYKQIVANQAQAQQSALDSTKEAITQQVDLLNTIIQALQTIVASIFK